jgi:tyrosyl-tRNA synthetase
LKNLHPGDLKSATEKYLNAILEPIRKEFESDELKKLTLEAYPPPDKKQKAKH